MAFNLGELLVGTLLPVIKSVGTDQLVALFEQLKAKDEKAYKTVLNALYPIVDVQLEALVTKSKSKIDDSLIAALKDAIEESAEKNGITLPNLDED